MTGTSRLGSLARAIVAAGGRYGGLAPLLFCMAAALCSTFLSGINFPEQNNRWQIPVVLDFAGSAEGPHDAYSRSFANFISLFWIGVRAFTDESNIKAVFVAIQLAGNALLAAAIFTLIRSAGRAAWPAAFVTGFLCFAYGLWGATALGYSEVFVTYATHTQYAVALSLFALACIMSGRPYLAGLLLGVAANINLFMAVWSALAAGIALVAIQRRIATREQVGFSALFLTIVAPVTLWGLTANSGGVIPVSFFSEFLAGHVYGLDYPRALVQCFALLLAAALAVRSALSGTAGQRLAIVMLAATAVLAAATAMPYLTDAPLLLLLHPLRFTSVAVVLAAACAGALFLAARDARADRSARGALFAAALALAGFVLKLPLVSVFGFALAVPANHRRLRAAAFALSATCTLALFLPSPSPAMAGKAALAFAMMSVILAAAALLRPEGAPLPLRLTAAALGGLATLPPTGGAVLLAAGASLCPMLPPRWQRAGAALAAGALLVLLWANRGDSAGLVLIGGGASMLVLAPMLARFRAIPPLARAGLVALVPLLIAAGFANGVRTGFAPNPTEAQRDFLAAQRWVRTHTPRDALIMTVEVDDGFSLFSRRPVWWEQSQGAAVLWQPSFLPVWRSRKAALEAASTPQEIAALARREKVAYLVVPSAKAASFAGGAPAYANAHIAVIRPSQLPE